MSYIEIDNLSKEFASFRGGGSVVALKNVSHDVNQGTFVSIVGPSGCGKSTLLKIVAGLLEQSSGKVLFDGKQVTGPPRGMVYLFQQYSRSLFPWRTVRDNVAFGPENAHSMKKEELRQRCQEIIRRVGLAGFEDHYPWQLSGGMQQRVAIARALVFQPKVLLMDEPFSAVDALTRVELQDLLLELWRDFDLTVLFVTHDIDEAIYLSEEVVVLKPSPGEIAAKVAVELPTPRDQLTTRELPEYLELRHDLLELVFSFADTGAAEAEQAAQVSGDDDEPGLPQPTTEVGIGGPT